MIEYQILTEPIAEALFLSDEQGGPIRITLSDQFIERCGFSPYQKKALHLIRLSPDDATPVLATQDTTFHSPEEAVELADALVGYLQHQPEVLQVIPGGAS